MNDKDIKYMKIALEEAKKAYDKGEIPVGSIVVLDDKIISKGHNLRDSNQIVTKHAEIIAIEIANKKLNNWRLQNCILYTTLKPCSMCMEVIKAAKIKKVIYAASSNKENDLFDINTIQIDNYDLILESEDIIKRAFKNLREK